MNKQAIINPWHQGQLGGCKSTKNEHLYQSGEIYAGSGVYVETRVEYTGVN